MTIILLHLKVSSFFLQIPGLFTTLLLFYSLPSLPFWYLLPPHVNTISHTRTSISMFPDSSSHTSLFPVASSSHYQQFLHPSPFFSYPSPPLFSPLLSPLLHFLTQPQIPLPFPLRYSSNTARHTYPFPFSSHSVIGQGCRRKKR